MVKFEAFDFFPHLSLQLLLFQVEYEINLGFMVTLVVMFEALNFFPLRPLHLLFFFEIKLGSSQFEISSRQARALLLRESHVQRSVEDCRLSDEALK